MTQESNSVISSNRRFSSTSFIVSYVWCLNPHTGALTFHIRSVNGHLCCLLTSQSVFLCTSTIVAFTLWEGLHMSCNCRFCSLLGSFNTKKIGLAVCIIQYVVNLPFCREWMCKIWWRFKRHREYWHYYWQERAR